MDITLNGCPEGIAAAPEIRERFDVPVIYLTAHSDRLTLEEAKLTEPFGYILKPFEDSDLIVTLETAVYRHGIEKRLRETEAEIRERGEQQAAANRLTQGALAGLDLRPSHRGSSQPCACPCVAVANSPNMMVSMIRL
jgi:AmiR/NasT family two-component response regulator